MNEQQIIERIREIIEHPDSSYRSKHEPELRKLQRRLWRIDARREKRRQRNSV